MICRIDELKNKQVVCIKDGRVLGYISDIELDTDNGSLTSLIIYGRPKALGLIGREDDIIIRCRDIQLIGDDTILVKSTKNYIFAKSYTLKCESL